MRAVTCRHAELTVSDRPTPVPGPGQLLIDVERCGICGSDLHARHQCDELADVMQEAGYCDFMRSDQEVVFGHEFTGRVAAHGATRRPLPEGTPVVALPLLRRGGDVHALGLSAAAPGAYAEQLIVEESLALAVPNGLSPDVAVLTEPMAVGWHAVRRGEVGKRDVAIVIGCGPVGLAIICLLKARGVRTIIASDPSPGRRALATACGAQSVVDPNEESPYASAAEHGHLATVPAALELAIGAVEKLDRLPVPWWHTWRALERVGVTTPKAPVVFECVGIPGMLDGVIAGTPLFSRVVVVGVCMGADRLRPALAINKEIDLRFVVGYTPPEFRDALHMLAEGEVDASPMVTGVVGLDGVEAAFEALGNPESHAKIIIDPGSVDPELRVR
ncbi:MAG: zinc-binding dehydrogenase [Solirubrobacterales bacterium]|nr:zinc-binding dehydrogenase [Solirubrobacterales bacterium]